MLWIADLDAQYAPAKGAVKLAAMLPVTAMVPDIIMGAAARTHNSVPMTVVSKSLDC